MPYTEGYDRTIYQYNPVPATLDQAQALCRASGTQLTTVNSADELAFLERRFLYGMGPVISVPDSKQGGAGQVWGKGLGERCSQ